MSDASQFEHWFVQAEDASYDERQEGERAEDYRDGKQLSAAEMAELERRGQPAVVINRIRRKIEYLKGLEVQRRTDPKAFPRTPNHEAGAEAATDAIRFVCDNAAWDTARSAAAENIYVQGMCGVEVIHEQTPRGDVEIKINHYPWDRLFRDPHSRKPDFSDARYRGVVLWMDEADFLADYGDKKDHLTGLYSESSSDTYDDKPSHWCDSKRKRIRVIFMWYRKGREWHYAKFIKGTVLDEGVSPYVDEAGETVCPLIMQSGFIGRNNDRHGIVRDMFDPQDEVNKRRSKALFATTSRQTIGVAGAVASVAAMKSELSKPDGHVEVTTEALEDAARVGMKPFDILPTNDQAVAQFQLLQEAKAEIDMLGANAALAGEGEDNSSGRAIQAKQQGGLVEIASLNDRISNLTLDVYRHIWMRVRQYWTEERWVRVTDDEKNVRFVGLNRPVTLQEKLGQLPPEQVAQFARQNGLYPGHPALMEPVEIENNVAEMDVDIILEEVPDVVNLEGEMFQNLVNLASSQPGTVPPEMLVEAMPGLKRDLKDRLLESIQGQQQAQAQQGQMAMQADMAERQANIKKTETEAMENAANAQKLARESSIPPAMRPAAGV